MNKTSEQVFLAFMARIMKQIETNGIKVVGSAIGGDTSDLASEDTLNDILSDTSQLERQFWISLPQKSIEYTYYTGVEANNPSGNKNIKTAEYIDETSGTTIFSQTFHWDSDDDVVKILTS